MSVFVEFVHCVIRVRIKWKLELLTTAARWHSLGEPATILRYINISETLVTLERLTMILAWSRRTPLLNKLNEQGSYHWPHHRHKSYHYWSESESTSKRIILIAVRCCYRCCCYLLSVCKFYLLVNEMKQPLVWISKRRHLKKMAMEAGASNPNYSNVMQTLVTVKYNRDNSYYINYTHTLGRTFDLGSRRTYFLSKTRQIKARNSWSGVIEDGCFSGPVKSQINFHRPLLIHLWRIVSSGKNCLNRVYFAPSPGEAQCCPSIR